MAEIDVTKSSLKDNRFGKDILVDMLRNIPQKERAKLKTKLSDASALYNLDTINRGNQVLNFLKDNGYPFDIQARADGKGLMAKLRQLGGSDFLVTIAAADSVSRKNSKESLINRASYVGNVVMNNRSFYVSSRGRSSSLDNSFEMVKALTGKLKVKTRPGRDKDKFDLAYDILDENGQVQSSFFRNKERDYQLQEQQEAAIERDDEFDELFGDDTSLDASPLQRLIEETNLRIKQEAGENNTISIINQGFREDIEVHKIEVDNFSTYDGLDLDMLLVLNDRSTIADTITREMLQNDEFTLDNENIHAEEGLKDLLMENTAGVRAKEVNPLELGPNYQALLDLVKENLEKQSIENAQVTIDEDHVIHWTGDNNTYTQNGELKSSEQRQGAIGQVFLPEEDGLIHTKFNTVEASSDRNYKMVPSYTAYYADQSGYQIMPKTQRLTIDGRTGDFLMRENGEVFKMPAPGTKVPRAWVKEEVSPAQLASFMEAVDNANKRGNRQYAQLAVEEREKGRLEPMTVMHEGKEVVADTEGKPLVVKNKMYPKDIFTEDVLKSQIDKVKNHNIKNPNNPLPMIGTKEVKPTLRESIRVRGFDQSLEQNIEAIVARQVLQNETSYKDNVSLNKLYHGDVYGTRIKNDNLAYPSIIETYKRRVRFPNDVTNMTAEELGEFTTIDSEGKPVEIKKTATHRHNLKAFEGIFDRSLSSDGQALGKIKYLNEGVNVNKDGSLDVPENNYDKRAPIYNDLPYTWGDPSDRAMMGANQVIKSRNVSKCYVALMTYKGYTFEDDCVVSENYAKEQGAIVNGYDENGKPIPLQPGDKVSDKHGNKAIIGYIGSPEKDEFFRQNPDIDVIMNPHSIPSRMNTGVVLEMQHHAKNGEPMKEVMFNGSSIVNAGVLNVVVTDITAKSKTHTYEKGEGRLGRSFGVQEAWVANALELDDTMDEIYGHNQKSFERLRKYMNVTGLELDENGVMYQSNGVKYDPETEEYNVDMIDLNEYNPEDGLSLPEGDAAMKLPFKVDLPSGQKSDTLFVLPEEHRKTQELYDGGRMYHDYSRVYADIAQKSAEFVEKRDGWEQQLNKGIEKDDPNYQDLSQIDFSSEKQREAFINQFDEAERHQVHRDIEQSVNQIQGKTNQLTERVIEDKLGGHLTYDEDKDRSLKDTDAIKRSIMKRDIMGRQVPHSATSVVSADPYVDINTIKVSPEIYDKMNLKNPEEDRVLLWRDPALHDGSMRSFKIEKDENIVGVGINPLVTESFGMDFDGDTVGLYAPKSEKAQQELRTKAALENHLIDPTSEEFTGNIGMDFVSSAYKGGYVGEDIIQGPLKDRQDEVKDMNPKDQLQMMLTEMAQKEDGWKEINQLWKDTVTSEEYNIGASKIEPSSRDAMKESMMHQARIGAKGKVEGISSKVEQKFDALSKERGEEIPYSKKMASREFRSPEGNGNKPTVMQYYDRGVYLQELSEKKQSEKDPVQKQKYDKQLEYMLTPGHYKKDEKTGLQEWVEHYGSLGRDYNRTREAQAGKVDLTGRAGAKSQMLVSIMYDQKEGAMAAMEVTEPLTQATLKLKHNPDDTPKIENLLNDYDKMLNQGGLDRNGFKDKFKGEDGMYSKVGLNVNDKHLDKVFDALSDKDSDNPKTRPIDDVLQEKMSPLMKVNMYGYDAMRDMAKDNNDKLQKMAQGHRDIHLESFKDGENSNRHVPRNLGNVTSKSIAAEAEMCYQQQLEKERAKNRSIEQEVDKEQTIEEPSKKEQQPKKEEKQAPYNLKEFEHVKQKVNVSEDDYKKLRETPSQDRLNEVIDQYLDKHQDKSENAYQWHREEQVVPVEREEAYKEFERRYDELPKEERDVQSLSEYIEQEDSLMPIEQKLEIDQDYQDYKRHTLDTPNVSFEDYTAIKREQETFKEPQPEVKIEREIEKPEPKPSVKEEKAGFEMV